MANNRRTATIVVLVLFAILVAAAVAYLAGRSRGAGPPTSAGGSAITTPSTSEAPAPTYSPTDQFGSPEPGLARGDVPSGEGGAQAGPEGMPLGYPHTPSGAVS